MADFLRRRLSFEALEPRQLLAVDLVLDRLYLVDGRGRELTTPPPIGERVFVKAEWHSSDLTSAATFIVRASLDGATIDSSSMAGKTGSNATYNRTLGGWPIAPGAHTITFTVDAAGSVAEANEANNIGTLGVTPSSPNLSAKFVWPIAGVQSVDWAIESYLDADPRNGPSADYRGGPATYDDHDGVDFAIANFAAMDRGVAVYAAAAGTVVESHDGNFDRWLEFANPEPPANWVEIDHGNGWHTVYFHLKRGSVAVSEGNQVVAGQQIGQVGASGGTPLPQLHFEVRHNGAAVETFLAPNDYYASPRPYTLDALPGVLDFGVTNAPPTHETIAERVSDIEAFPSNTTRYQTYAWAIFSSLQNGDTLKVKYVRPDGAVYSDATPRTVSQGGAWYWDYWNVRLPASPQAGLWKAEFYVNNVLVGSRAFQVGPAVPEIKVIQPGGLEVDGETLDLLIIDGRTTPIPFGVVSPGAPPPTQTFTVQNHGYGNLNIAAVDLPFGYSLVKPLAASIGPNSSDTFTVRLETSISGLKAGFISIRSNDGSESSMDFAVEGRVTGASTVSANFDQDADVDGADFLTWQRNFGRTGTAAPTQGNADNDSDVDAIDLAIWRSQFGGSFLTVASSSRLLNSRQGELGAFIEGADGAFPMMHAALLGPSSRSSIAQSAHDAGKPPASATRRLVQKAELGAIDGTPRALNGAASSTISELSRDAERRLQHSEKVVLRAEAVDAALTRLDDVAVGHQPRMAGR